MKQKTPEQELDLLREKLLHERDIWNHINENSCNDPFWTDGCNMNLTRNHILSYRNEIANCCEEHNLPLPEEYFLKVPPEVDDDYIIRGVHGEFYPCKPDIFRETYTMGFN